jgi:hypothetical protein
MFINSYSDIRKVDKLTLAQSKVDQVRLAMQDNVKMMIENQTDFTVS